MNKSELISSISFVTDMPRDAAGRALDAALDIIVESVKNGDPVFLPKFGTFTRKYYNERRCRNPVTGENMVVAAHYRPYFKPGRRLKDAAGEK